MPRRSPTLSERLLAARVRVVAVLASGAKRLVVLSIAVLVAICGVALAVPGGGGTIQGCINERGGVRLVDTGASCEAAETALSWNQQGPPGARGEIGPPGARGEIGPPGRGSEPTPVDAVEIGKLREVFQKGAPPLSKSLAQKLASVAPVAGEARSVWRDTLQFTYTGSGAPESHLVARLPLPKGRWVVFAKAWAVTNATTSCQLEAGADSDQIVTEPGRHSVALHVVHGAAKPFGVFLHCALTQAGAAAILDAKVTAMRVGKLTNTPFGG